MPLQLAMKVNIVLHYWIGFVGMHLLLTRVIGVTFLPAVIFLATLVTASGAPAIHLRVGHSVFLPGFYLPLQLYFFFKAFKTGEWKYIFLAVGDDGVDGVQRGHAHPADVGGRVGHLCGVRRHRARVTGGRSPSSRYSGSRASPTPRLSCCRSLQFVTGEQFWDTRIPTEKPDLVTPEMLRQTYLTPTQRVGSRLPMQRHGWHEYGNYIGIGSAVAADRRFDLCVLARPTTIGSASRWR